MNYNAKEKCTFGLQQVHYLGHIIFQDGVKMDEEKISSITSMADTKNIDGIKKIPWFSQVLSKIHQGFYY